MVSKSDTWGMEAIPSMKLGGGARKRCTFVTMDVTVLMSIASHRDAIVKRYAGLENIFR